VISRKRSEFNKLHQSPEIRKSKCCIPSFITTNCSTEIEVYTIHCVVLGMTLCSLFVGTNVLPTSCRSLFKQLEILLVSCHYILSFINIRKIFKEIHVILIYEISTNLIHQCQPNLFKKNAFYVGIKIFNSSPCSLKTLKNEQAKFKIAVRKSLSTHSFYFVHEFFLRK